MMYCLLYNPSTTSADYSQETLACKQAYVSLQIIQTHTNYLLNLENCALDIAGDIILACNCSLDK